MFIISSHSTVSNRFEKQNSSKSCDRLWNSLLATPSLPFGKQIIQTNFWRREMPRNRAEDVFLWRKLKWRGSTPARSWPPSCVSPGLATWSRVQVKQVAILKQHLQRNSGGARQQNPRPSKSLLRRLYLHFLDPFAESYCWWPARPPCTQHSRNKQRPADTQRHLQNTHSAGLFSRRGGGGGGGVGGARARGSHPLAQYTHTHTHTPCVHACGHACVHTHTPLRKVCPKFSPGPARRPRDLIGRNRRLWGATCEKTSVCSCPLVAQALGLAEINFAKVWWKLHAGIDTKTWRHGAYYSTFSASNLLFIHKLHICQWKYFVEGLIKQVHSSNLKSLH